MMTLNAIQGVAGFAMMVSSLFTRDWFILAFGSVLIIESAIWRIKD